MKIRTDFVTNSSSSSFTLVINFELISGKNVRFVGAGRPDDWQGELTEDPDYYGYALTMDASPKELGSADSVRELINILKRFVFDADEQIFMKSNPKSTWVSEIVDNDGLEDVVEVGYDAYDFIETIQREIASMDDIVRITVEGNEDYGYRGYKRSYTYDRKTGKYTGIEVNAYDDEIQGYHGGDLIFETPCPSDMRYLSEDNESEKTKSRSVYPAIRSIEGTGYEGRAARIEFIKVGDLVVLKADYNAPPSLYCMNNNPVLRIEVFNINNESLGYLSTYEPPYSTDIVKDLDRLGARVVSVTPRSARGPRAKIALMDIELFIKNEDTDKEYAKQEEEERQAAERKRQEEERREAERLRLQTEKEKATEARRVEKQRLEEERKAEQLDRQRSEEHRRKEREKKRADAPQRLKEEKAAKAEHLRQLEEERKQNLFKNVICLPGKEPENIRRRIDTLFKKLDDAYPDKQISKLQTTHKKWAETVTELYRLLGYADGQSFLEAYGYTVVKDKGGRTASNDYRAIIDELKRRYPNGSGLKTVSALVEKNKDLPMKTLSNNAVSLFGMSLKDYLKKHGIL